MNKPTEDGRNPFLATRSRSEAFEPLVLPAVGHPRSPDEHELVAKTRLHLIQEGSMYAKAELAKELTAELAERSIERLLSLEESVVDLQSRIDRLPERSKRLLTNFVAAVSEETGHNFLRIGEAAAHGMAEIATRPVEVDPPEKPGLLDRLLG